MALNLYPVCHRGRQDCEPIHCIASEPESLTEDQFLNFDYDPPSFVCCGCNSPESRRVDQDRYRLCFKNDETDEMTDNDMQDLTSIVAVIGAALNLDAVRKIQNGIVEVPAVNKGGVIEGE